MNSTNSGGFEGDLDDVVDAALFAFPAGSPMFRAAVEAAAEGLPCDGAAAARSALCAYTGARSYLSSVVVETAHEVLGDAPKMNRTSEWLNTHYTEVFTMLVKHLSVKMTRSRDLCVVEDHVQKLLTRLIAKDTLAPLLERGVNPKDSVLRVWAYQSAVTELRRWGVDAALRVTRAAKTSREVEQGKAWKVVQAGSTAREVYREEEGSNDLYDPGASSPEDNMVRKSRLAQVRKALTRIGRTDLVPVMEGLLEGRTLPELRATFGTATDQLGAVIQTLRV